MSIVSSHSQYSISEIFQTKKKTRCNYAGRLRTLRHRTGIVSNSKPEMGNVAMWAGVW